MMLSTAHFDSGTAHKDAWDIQCLVWNGTDSGRSGSVMRDGIFLSHGTCVSGILCLLHGQGKMSMPRL